MALKQAVQALWARLGATGGAALLLTAAAAAAGLALARQQEALDAERHALRQQRQALQRLPAAAAAPPAGPAAFLGSLPADAERQARTAALLALSTELGLAWPRTDFRYQTDRELGLSQYRVQMTLSGSYGALRRYIAEALRRDPALALDSARLRREGGTLRAELSWTLLMQASPQVALP